MGERREPRSRAAAGVRGLQVRKVKGQLKVVAIKGHRWVQADEDVFLDHLAATSNVALAAKAAGFSTVAVRARRRIDAAFAAKWQAAVEQGVEEIQLGLIQAARAAVSAEPRDPAGVVAPMSYDQALNLLKLHGHAVGLGGTQRPAGAIPRRRSIAELKAGLLEKIEAVRAAHRREAEDRDAPEGGTAE